ncbi:MAG: response regulator transcription factor [Dehalococcoidia bacterium]
MVLVVDDHPRALRFIELGLRFHGFEVSTASSGEEALESARSNEPDIMLLDIIMPGIDGCEVLRQLRGFSQVPVIAFSASLGERGRAMQSGADTFISKPFDMDDLVKRITTILQC